jgi:large subunit ribosomal protein L15
MAENKKDAPADAETTAKKPARKPAAKAETAAAEKPAKATKAAAKADAPKAEAKAAAEKSEKPAKAAKADTAAEKPAAKATKATAKADAPKAAPSSATEGLGGTLRVHHLRPAPGAHTPKTRVGRGEGSKGKTAGRGTKGTKARYQVPERREGGGIPLHMRQPKLRGFKNPFKTTYQVVNLDRLAELYPSGGAVTAEDLVAKGAVRKGQPVKVLGVGDVAVKLDVSVTAVSATAREKILAAGGSVQE